MIKLLIAQRFRKHDDVRICFTGGLNVIRGVNESGKSTTGEAILYALYGTKALRTSLEETVTWGHKPSELKVKLTICIGGVDYLFSRSKAGAEVTYEGGMVTGQAEVTKFAGDLLGADAKTASLLMLASQDGLRGALSDGPAKVSELMAKLADFEILDKVLEQGQKSLTLGSEEPLRLKLAETAEALETLKAEAPSAAVLESVVETLTNAGADLARLELVANETLQPAFAAADSALNFGIAHNNSRARAESNLEALQTRLSSEKTRLDAATADAGRRPADTALPELQAQLASAGQHQVLVDQHAKFQALPKYPDVFWDGPAFEMRDEIASLTQKMADATNSVGSLQGEIRGLEASVLTQGKCPTCGQDVNGDAHIAERNAELAAKVALLVKDIAGLREGYAADKSSCNTLKMLDADGQVWVKLGASLGALVSVDEATYPPRLAWVGGVVAASIDVKPIKAKIAQVQQALDTAQQALGRASAHKASIVEIEASLAGAVAVLTGLPLKDTAPLRATYDEAYRLFAEMAVKIEGVELEVAGLKRQKIELDLFAATHAEKVRGAASRIAELNAEIEAVAYNNAFIKKVKSLKPAVTDFLWAQVLTAVSTFFSSMRGEASVVTKDKDGFKVNGQSIDSLSGSTLDVLALATRVALTKTFIPHATFLTLDEPSSGCDIGRTGNMLGFLASCGMDQVILASHDELSESVADNVIALGV